MSNSDTALDILSTPNFPQFLARLFTSDFMPHGHCFFWRPEILWLHVLSDFAIGLAYYLIPFALFQFVRRRKDLVFNWMFILFAVFILACGTTHFMNIWTMWHGTYRLDGIIKLVTALASISTAILLYPLIPKALALKSPAQLEIEVQARTRELMEANKELEQFAYVASHDLQEPLRTVSNYVDLLSVKTVQKLSPEEREYLKIAMEGAERAQHLIRDLLEFSRAGAKGDEPKMVDMNDVVRKALANLQAQTQSAKADIRVDLLPKVTADASQMLHLIQNLLSNAIKYRGSAPLKVVVSAAEKSDEWVFTVEDNGIGIDAQYHEKVFALFQRLHDRRKYPGTGIGLSICKKIVERHKGKIKIESQLGKGARFLFTLPKGKQL